MKTRPYALALALLAVCVTAPLSAQIPGGRAYPASSTAFLKQTAALMPPSPLMHPATMSYPGMPPMVQPVSVSHLVGGTGELSDDSGWCHGISIFGEYLFLRARDAEVTYGSEVDSGTNPLTAPPVQMGRMGVVDQDFDPGFRFGVGYTLNTLSSLGLEYTMFETGRSDRIDRISTANVVQSNLFHPATVPASQGGTFATGEHALSFDHIDIVYRRLLSWDHSHQYNWLIGFRYTSLEQQFRHTTDIAPGDRTVLTDIDFSGYGLRFGLEGERYFQGLKGYAKFLGSLLPGDVTATYHQGFNFDAQEAYADWETVGRIMTQWDLELGIGWASQCGTWNVSGGYVCSAWTNVVKTDEFIDAVRHNNFVGLGDVMTFDGLVFRLEGRF